MPKAGLQTCHVVTSESHIARLLVRNYRTVAIPQHYSGRDERCRFCRPSWLGTGFDEVPGVFLMLQT
jgi:hypothetical protein